jgi:uncharacterized membrane protein
MKKTACFAVLAFLLLFSGALYAQTANLDVVVMVDVSESMFPIFDDLVTYLLDDLVWQRLHPGDSFHLLSFASTAEVEISEPITAASNLTAIIERILLLKPLGHYTDLIAALEFLYAYVDSLPGTNDKLVLLLTDGIQDPPPGSVDRLSPRQSLLKVLDTTEKIKRKGWDVHILVMPRPGAAPQGAIGEAGAQEPVPGGVQPQQGVAGAPGAQEGAAAPAGAQAQAQEGAAAAEGGGSERYSGPVDLLEPIEDSLNAGIVTYEQVEKQDIASRLTGFPTIQFPGFLGRVSRRFKAPFAIVNSSSSVDSFKLVGITTDGSSILGRPLLVVVPPEQVVSFDVPIVLPRSVPGGRQELPIRLEFEGEDLRIAPLEGTLSFDLFVFTLPRIPADYLRYGLPALLAVAVIVVLVLVIRRRLRDAAFARFFEGVSQRRAGRGAVRPLILKVEGQNPNIGSRNIHAVPRRSSASVGGDGSTFLIYYLPVPRRIADIRNDGEHYVLIPRKLEHFVELDTPLQDCLGKEIRVLSTRGQTISLRFLEYVSPLEQINELMRSIRHFPFDPLPVQKPPEQ